MIELVTTHPLYVLGQEVGATAPLNPPLVTVWVAIASYYFNKMNRAGPDETPFLVLSIETISM